MRSARVHGRPVTAGPAAVSAAAERPASPEVSPEADLRTRLAAVARAHGFAGAVYMHVGHVLDGAADPSFAPAPRRLAATGGFDGERYLRRDYLRHDPLAARAATEFTPFAWTLSSLDRGSPARARVLAAFAAWGVEAGVVAPVQDHALGPAFLNLHRREADSAARADEGALLLEAARLHAAVRAAPAAFGETTRPDRLSAREMQVLRLAAMGRTEQETAAALALSRRGAQFHLARAVDKLAAANKTAAVARAVSAGLIAI